MMYSFTVHLLLLPIFLHSTLSIPPFATNKDWYLEQPSTKDSITSTFASTPFINRVSHRKCQEYQIKSLTNTFYAEEVTNVISNSNSNPTIINTITNRGHIPTGIPVQILVPGEIKLNTEKAESYEPVESNIYGGKDSMLREFPHMAAIGWLNSDGSYAFDCGGTLISPRFVLTAAHCTYSHVAEDPIPKFVRFGDLNIDSSIYDGAVPTQVNIKSIYNHPQYTRKKNYNDIALLELETEITSNKYIVPACLWNSSDFGEHLEAIAIGWGVVDPWGFWFTSPNSINRKSA